MRRISKKKLVALFAIVLTIAIIAISVGLSRALKKEIIQVNIVDSEGKLLEESLTIEGIIDDDYHYICLPRVVNSHIVENLDNCLFLTTYAILEPGPLHKQELH